MARKRSGIPGLSFSWKRALGITAAKQRIARATGIPTTKAGRQQKNRPNANWRRLPSSRFRSERAGYSGSIVAAFG